MKTEKTRSEHDSMGNIEVPCDKYWGAQTQRSLENFKIGEKMPMEVIYVYANLKKACAKANCELGILSEEKSILIEKVCDEIINGKLDDHFPLVVYQTGSGTQTNMNINEVIANRGNVIGGGNIDDSIKILNPNDDVNKSQSSNDTFPTVMNIVALQELIKLKNSVLNLCSVIYKKSQEFSEIIKIGRTHLMDATPISFGQEFSGYNSVIAKYAEDLDFAKENLYNLSIGATAVGTGLNAPKNFDKLVCKYLSKFCEIEAENIEGEYKSLVFTPDSNKFASLSTNRFIFETHNLMKGLATYLMKISNDIRFMASGPRCGLGELILPANEPGSSIMPGKVNPTQIEALTMVCAKVIGNDATIAIGEMNGQFELNTYRPLIISCFLESAKLLTQAINSFSEHCLQGIKVNKEKIKYYTENSLMLVTVLSPKIGYENAAKVAKKAYDENITLKQAAVDFGFISSEEYDEIVDIRKML